MTLHQHFTINSISPSYRVFTISTSNLTHDVDDNSDNAFPGVELEREAGSKYAIY